MVIHTEPIQVAAAVILEDDCYLITRRLSDTHCGNLWEFPGGKVLPGESLDACLVREIREELGIIIQVYELMETIFHSYPDLQVVLHFFRCVRLSGHPAALGCAAFDWVPAAEFSRYPFPAADALFLEKLKRFGDMETYRKSLSKGSEKRSTMREG
jgi:mutator protein MutT